MQKLLLIGWIGSFVCAFLSYPIAGLISSGAVEAYVIVPKDKDSIDVEKAIWEPPKGKSKDSPEYRNAVMRIYGVPVDDPQQRRPDITRARQVLGWEPQVSLEEGLSRLLRALGREPAAAAPSP